MNDAREASGYAPFLLAKRAIDERALNERIWASAMHQLDETPAGRAYRILELGAGVGGMLERILARTAVRQLVYTVVEPEATHIDALRVELCAFGEREGYRVDAMDAARLVLTRVDRRVEIQLAQEDVFAFLERPASEAYDLLVAQAFLDLFEIEPLMSLLVSAVVPGGGLYFPITFDGVSSWLPVIDAAFDDRVEHQYHRSMDARGAAMDRAPRSRTGRHVVYHLARRTAIAAVESGGSDWIVCAPFGGELQAGEAAFLHALLDGYERELTGQFEDESEQWRAWLTLRRRSIDTGGALFLAHHLDIFAQRHF